MRVKIPRFHWGFRATILEGLLVQYQPRQRTEVEPSSLVHTPLELGCRACLLCEENRPLVLRCGNACC